MSEIKDLRHVRRVTPSGIRVTVLNNGAVIKPEAEAMLHALYSRSHGGLDHHLEKVDEKGSDGFIDSHYVGYGHDSIGDCGTTSIFVEGGSMHVAKAIQDWRLYSGQECSTRFMRFDEQPFINPLGTPEGERILERWRAFYVRGLPIVVESLKERFPLNDGEDPKLWEKAINARACDIMRGFLPSGASTGFSWLTNLRQAKDHLMLLRHHPLAEVREVAEAMEDALKEAHPHSFNHKRYPETEAYNAALMGDHYYESQLCPEFEGDTAGYDFMMLNQIFGRAIRNRPPKTNLPSLIGLCGLVRFEFLLDFGSWRDFQRQRSVWQVVPLLTLYYGFEQWYLNELPEGLRMEAENFLEEQEFYIDELDAPPELKQYYIAMGYRIPMLTAGDLKALVYVVELRATRFVHPTLCHRAQQMAKFLESRFGPYGLVLHLDAEPGRFDIRRGTHDIVLK